MNKKAIDYYKSISSRIESLCKPLNDYLGISLCTYFKVYKDSSYISLSNDINFMQKYCSTVNSDKVYFHKYIDSIADNKIYLWPDNPTNLGMNTYFDCGYWHGMSVSQSHDDYVEVMSFVSNKNNQLINNLFIRDHNILEKFTIYFKHSLGDVIIEAQRCKARFNDGCNLYIPKKEIINHSYNTQGFLDEISSKEILKINDKYIQLTPSETKCIKLIAQGDTMKNIAQKLLLSPRTIESHINNIKNKTGCHYKQDLIKIYHDSL